MEHLKKAKKGREDKMQGCVYIAHLVAGCSRSNSGSNPGILPNIVHKVKFLGQSTYGTLGKTTTFTEPSHVCRLLRNFKFSAPTPVVLVLTSRYFVFQLRLYPSKKFGSATPVETTDNIYGIRHNPYGNTCVHQGFKK